MYRSRECGLSHVPQNTDCPFAKLSAAVAGPSGPPSGTDAMQPPVGVAPSTRSKSGICSGVVWLVPEGSRVVQAEVMPEQFAEVVGRARGPPTLEWCQAAALCASCTRRGEQCEFEEPALGVWRDTSVCLPCHSGHEKCSVTLSWWAVCVVAEQGWDRDWVAAQLEEGRKGRVSGRGSGAGEGEWVSAPVMKVGPPWGTSKQAWGEQVMGGLPGSTVYSPTSRAPVEPSADRSWLVVEAYLRRRVEGLEQLLVVCEEEIQGELEVRTVHLQAWAEVAEVATQQAGGSGVRETQQGSSAGEVQAAAERAWRQEEWLANEAALGQQGVLCDWFLRFRLLSTDSVSIDWAKEHRILLNGASAALGSIHDGLARMPGDLLPELGQGVTQMTRLLAGHQRRATADPGAWWEMATDVGKPLPGQPEVLAVVVAQLEVFMVGRVAGLGSEEEGE
ncbi:hypothetical protein E4T56_gene18517 [Termitomyces sp. T112]|nr:hypothetical protein E4T56_gene18517 [Termitomyces sp. T112]